MATAQQKASAGVYVTDDIGLEVTDGTRTRVQLGLLPSGSYGLAINDASGNAIVDGSKVQLAQSAGTVPAGVALGISQTAVSANGVTVNDGTHDRAILGNIGSSYGLKVVASDGTTVIIDGSSDVFKIQASGTLSVAPAALSGNNYGTGSTSTTLTGLGTLSASPAHLSFLTDTANGITSLRRIGSDNLGASTTALWASAASGGAITSAYLPFVLSSVVTTSLDGSNHCVVGLYASNSTNTTPTFYATYYVLIEAAM